MVEMQGKIALVTGASSGIGAATADALAAAGASVVCADVQDKLGEQIVQEIERDGGEATYVHCDVSDADEIQAMVDAALDTYGGLDIAVNNAGIEGEHGPAAEQTVEGWDRVLDTNLRGTFLCMKAEIPVMLERGGGAIVNVSSIAGLTGFEGSAPYVASKHGLVGLTRSAALDYAKQGIRVNAVCPGVIDTPMVERYTHDDPEAEAGLAEAEPMGRMGEAAEIADAIVYLASDEASFVTGHPMAVDGGWMAR